MSELKKCKLTVAAVVSTAAMFVALPSAALAQSVPAVQFIDMYQEKAPVSLEPDPAAMPIVVSAGTRGQTLQDGCVEPGGAVCAYDQVYRLFHLDFTGPVSGVTLTATTANLRPWPDHGAPDTLLYLLKCVDETCAGGTVVAIDDNGNSGTADPGDSLLTAQVDEGGLYRLVLTTKYQGSEGTADLTVSLGDDGPAQFRDLNFGGWHVRNRTVMGGDSLFVGKNSNSMTAGAAGHREYHDSQMLFLATNLVDCDTDCGGFYYNDDFAWGKSSMFLSKIDFPRDAAPVTGRVIVGVFDDTDIGGARYSMNARLFHYRRNVDAGGAWATAGSVDADGDGLTYEIEQAVDSCDTDTDVTPGGVGIQGMSCAGYAARIKDYSGKWSPADSDNDGIGDAAEVFAVGVHCAGTPVPPYNNPGPCRAFGIHDDPVCPEGQYCVGLDVSALSDPNPNVYDVYILNDYIKSGSHEYRVTAAGQEYLKTAWHDAARLCWDGSEPPCEGADDVPYLFNVHAYSDQGPGLPVNRHDFADANFGKEIGGGVRWTLAYFNRFFKPEFKYTGVGFFALSTPGPEGQSKRGYRSLAWRGAHDNDGRSHSDVLAILSHESGHILGLTDLDYTKFGYSCGNPADCPVVCPEIFIDLGRDRSRTAWPQYPNTPSLMNYGYNSFGAGLRELTAPVPRGTARYHEGCSKKNLRFSKGLLGTLSELELHEINPVSRGAEATWQDRMLVRELECFTDKGRSKAPETDPFRGHCDDASCRVNWDAYRFEGDPPEPPAGPYRFDLSMGNLGGKPADKGDCSNDQIVDRNELATMQAVGKESRGRAFQPEFEIFKATFNGGLPENLAGWDIPVSDPGVSYEAPDGAATFRKSARFSGLGASYLRLSSTGPDSPIVAIADSNKLMIRFDFFAEVNDGSSPIQFLVGNEDVRIYLKRGSDDGSLTITGYVGSSPVSVNVQAHRWNRVFLHTDAIDGRNVIRLAVAPWNSETGSFTGSAESCPGCAVVCSRNTWAGDFDANTDIWIGSHVGGMFPFTGLIDNINIGNFVFRPAVPTCP